ncbi:hypothetical protein HDU97_009867 [Phlyctochytrium planicorne]|nr:hypothetical protein HDU97_009867 [Phlyctochytrium planicorne]
MASIEEKQRNLQSILEAKSKLFGMSYAEADEQRAAMEGFRKEMEKQKAARDKAEEERSRIAAQKVTLSINAQPQSLIIVKVNAEHLAQIQHHVAIRTLHAQVQEKERHRAQDAARKGLEKIKHKEDVLAMERALCVPVQRVLKEISGPSVYRNSMFHQGGMTEDHLRRGGSAVRVKVPQMEEARKEREQGKERRTRIVNGLPTPSTSPPLPSAAPSKSLHRYHTELNPTSQAQARNATVITSNRLSTLANQRMEAERNAEGRYKAAVTEEGMKIKTQRWIKGLEEIVEEDRRRRGRAGGKNIGFVNPRGGGMGGAYVVKGKGSGETGALEDLFLKRFAIEDEMTFAKPQGAGDTTDRKRGLMPEERVTAPKFTIETIKPVVVTMKEKRRGGIRDEESIDFEFIKK